MIETPYSSRLYKAVLTLAALLLLVNGCAKSKPASAQATAGVRPPVVAGSFYPAEPWKLRDEVRRLLEEARNGLQGSKAAELAGCKLRAVLVPHAGYVFSARTAAHAYAAISLASGPKPKLVLLLGSPHRVAVPGAAVYCGRGFSTPLGIVPVDVELARAIASSSPWIVEAEEPHAEEHSLEVQLPFLQEALDAFSVVPILIMGQPDVLEDVARAIARTVGKRRGGWDGVLLVISSDLAHYPSKEEARKSDARIVEAFCTLRGSELLAADAELLKRKVPSLYCTMCGLDAAYVGLALAKAAGADKAVVLHTSDSSDAGVEGAGPDQVVGYVAVAVLGSGSAGASASEQPSCFEPINEDEQRYLLATARAALTERCSGKAEARSVTPPELRRLFERRGVFVTLTKGGELRGCIGCYSSELPLYEQVARTAVASGFEDPRFKPLRAQELEDLNIEISVFLTRIEPIDSPRKFRPGLHGIILKHGLHSATFLPQVAVEQGWDRDTTLKELSLKAGLGPGAWKDKEARFFVYETQSFHE